MDFTNQLKAQGKHYKEALIIAGKERMRPILMTTLAMAIGMLPIALAKGTASEWKKRFGLGYHRRFVVIYDIDCLFSSRWFITW